MLNAHYTQPVVINAMYTALSELGFSGGKILEPAAGVGNFIGCAPENIPDGFYVSINDNIYKRNGSVLVEAKRKAARRLQKEKRECSLLR